ncbi:MAG: Xaa-Pro peptidase family protein [Thermoproteota archaeon]|nr:aminopeptidase P family protein [Candidatus Brockarchaeota archaeon]
MKKNKLNALLERMKKVSVDAIVIRNAENILFATGYWPVIGWSLLVVKSDGSSRLLVPDSEIKFITGKEADEIEWLNRESLSEVFNPYKKIKSFLENSKIRENSRIGCELSFETIASLHSGGEVSFANFPTFELLRKLTNGTLVDFSSELQELREVKDEEEIEKIKVACEIAAFGLEAGFSSLREGVSEAELASTIESEIYSKGIGYKGVKRVRGFAFVMSGVNGSEAYLPFDISSDKKIKKGESILIELNTYADGFWSDITRTWFLGEPEERLKSIYNAIYEATEKAVLEAKAGSKASEVDSIARNFLASKGITSEFNHRLGHGVGFRLHEPPNLHPFSNDIIKANSTFTIEPGAYGPNFGIRIEDVVLATKDKGIKLGNVPLEF